MNSGYIDQKERGEGKGGERTGDLLCKLVQAFKFQSFSSKRDERRKVGEKNKKHWNHEMMFRKVCFQR